jgi:predicted HTH transcriptional regulator
VKVETIKADLPAALPFLERKCFLKDGKVTTLGALVCGRHLVDNMGFRCQVHGYVDVPQEIARDKQDLADNILPLMESSLAYILRNIQVGISSQQGGQNAPQYPEQLLRETVNNALAHRDYSVNKQAIIAIKPGIHIAIRNPGAFRSHLLIESPDHAIPLRRIIPEAKPRNPKLADVLRVYRKWEGRGIGMATLVNLCLENQIDLPYYRFFSQEVCLHLCAGRLVDERMK